MKETRAMKVLIAVLLITIAVLSVTMVGKVMTEPSSYQHTIASLNEKEQNVLKLTAGATATSILITVIPDDIATPLADKLADVAGYLLLVICAVYAEKYLLTITGFAAFKLLIPAACVFGIISLFRKSSGWKQLSVKLAIFAMSSVLIIPVSIRASELVEGVYRESIESTIEDAEQAQDQVGTTEQIMEKAKSIINNYLQAVAIFIVTSCVIPVFVLLFFSWLMKLLFGISFSVRPVPFPRRRSAVGDEECEHA